MENTSSYEISPQSRIDVKASIYRWFLFAALTIPAIYLMQSCSESNSSEQSVSTFDKAEAREAFYNNCMNTRSYLHEEFPLGLSREICECKADMFIDTVPPSLFWQGPDSPESQRILNNVNKACECRFASESVQYYKGYTAGESVIQELIAWGCVE